MEMQPADPIWNTAAPLGSDGWAQPHFGLGDVPGGTFMGVGIGFATCLIPPHIQPAVPPGGLFGPDMPKPPIWRFPGYTPPPDDRTYPPTIPQAVR